MRERNRGGGARNLDLGKGQEKELKLADVNVDAQPDGLGRNDPQRQRDRPVPGVHLNGGVKQVFDPQQPHVAVRRHRAQAALEVSHLVGLGVGALGLGRRVWGLGLRVQGVGCRAYGFGLGKQGVGFRACMHDPRTLAGRHESKSRKGCAGTTPTTAPLFWAVQGLGL